MLVRSLLGGALGVALVLSASGCASSKDAGASGAPTTNDNNNLTSGTVLLDCSTFLSGGGPDQGITLRQEEGGTLVLRELTDNGATVERPVDASEWASRSLKLREDSPGDISTLHKESDGWVNESRGDGFRTYGYADCSVDRSRVPNER